MERASIIYNRAARNPPARERLRAAAQALRAEGWEIDLRETEAPGDATRLAREAAAAGARVVFACGGDGTINEVVNGLVGGEAALGVVRGGMGDVFAKEVAIPRSPAAALRLLVDGERRRFDLGRAGERCFLLMAGVGFDAAVVLAVPEGPKRRLGSAAYAIWGALTLLRYRPRPARLLIEGKERETDLFWLLLGNTRSYGGVIDVTREALVDDGRLDAYVFAARGLPGMIGACLRIALRRHRGAPGVAFHRLAELDVRTAGLPVQADGEYFGETPMPFSVAPAALDVLLPRGRADRLFSRPGTK